MENGIWDVAWDESASRLYRLAQQESIALGDDYVGTQHLLLAAVTMSLAVENGLVELSRSSVLSAVGEVIGNRNPEEVLLSPGGQTPRAKLVLQRAMERAFAESRPVNCQDVWHGLLAEESDCWLVLRRLGLQIEKLREKLA